MRSVRKLVPWASVLWLSLAAMSNADAGDGDVRALPWLAPDRTPENIAERVAVPTGFRRVAVSEKSFADWLRHLPVKPAGAPVRLHDGRLKARQDIHAAVIDIDVGTKDLQQCADAVMRLRAEYLYALGRSQAIHFNFTSGERIAFRRWAEGWRPNVAGNRVAWRRSGAPGTSYPSLRAYLEVVFTYAGTYSLAKEMLPVRDLDDMAIGDVFLEPGLLTRRF